MKRLVIFFFLSVFAFGNVMAQKCERENILLNTGWKFSFGNAADPAKDLVAVLSTLTTLQRPTRFITKGHMPRSLMILVGRR